MCHRFRQGRINHKAKCPGPTRKKGPTKGKRGKSRPTWTKKGPTIQKMKAIKPEKIFFAPQFQKVHMAYENLNPGLDLDQ